MAAALPSLLLHLLFGLVVLFTPPGAGKVYGQHTISVTLLFEHTAGTQPLELDKVYTNSFSESFSVSKFRYYISGIEFKDTITGKGHLVKDRYFLIKEGDETSQSITVELPQGKYHRLSFLVGVDSIKNVSGAQSGVLDPLNGMFWTWQSGYIMAKLEGRSPASPLQHRMFEYHIGGYSGGHSVLNKISLPFPEKAILSRETFLHITVDVNKWFDGVHPLSIAAYPACTTTGKLAKDFSENYQTMFAIKDIGTQ